MARKFIPDSDREFASMARVFAENIEREPGRYLLSADDAAIISREAQAFRDALALSMWPGTRTKVTVMRKNEARQRTERVIRRYVNDLSL
jgi:hypothetical protein